MSRRGRPPRKTGACHSQSSCERILTAAADLFAELGYHEANLRRIADRAGIDPAMIIRHYEGKAQLFTSVVDAAMDEVVRRTTAEQAQSRPPARIPVEPLQRVARLALAAAFAPAEVKRAVGQTLASGVDRQAKINPDVGALDARLGAVVCVELALSLLLAPYPDNPEYESLAVRMYAALDAENIVTGLGRHR